MEQLISEENQILNIILIAIGLLIFMSLAIVVFFYFSRKKIVKTELERARLEIEHQKDLLQSTIITQEEERRRIAQDLHDAISSKLNIVSLNANFLTEKDITVADANKFGESIHKVTGTVLENSRRIAHDLLPPALDKFGLEAALEELCTEVQESGVFKVEYDFQYPLGMLAPDEELHYFRMAQEVFNNAIKYSEASSIGLSLIATGESLVFQYQDDGKGFDVSEAMKARGLGMSGIKNRAAILNAATEISSTIGEGVLIRIEKRGIN